MDFARLLDSFLIAHRAAGRAGERTLKTYRYDLELFRRRFPGAVDTWTKDHVRMFLANPRWSNSTRLIRFKSLKAFFDFLLEEKILTTSPMAGVERPKGAKMARRPTRLTEEDIDLLLLACPEWTWIGLRDRAILLLFLTTPLRLAELAGIQLDQVDLHGMSIKVLQSKGNDEGYSAVLFPKAAIAIDRYLRKRPETDIPELWMAQKGGPLSAHAIQLVINRLEKRARAAGFSKHIWPHGFRHGFGVRTVQWGLAADVAAKSMGHKSEATVRLYRQWETENEALKQVRRVAGLAG